MARQAATRQTTSKATRKSHVRAAAAKSTERSAKTDDTEKASSEPSKEQLEKARLESEKAAVETRLKDEEALRIERDQAVEAATARLTEAFAELSHRSLKANSENFLRMAEQNLGVHQEKAKRELGDREQAIENLVRPIRDALKQSQEQINALEKARSEAYGGIREQLEGMQQSQASLAQETRNLVSALRRPEVRGRWGEMTLKRLVELAGMVEHCDFQEQVHRHDGEQGFRPDMIIRMPDRRELVVDVKTPLDAYLEAVEAPGDGERQDALKRHARNIGDHVRRLSSKAYWAQFERSPEFVILFIPGDQFLSAALDMDSELLETALSRQIILATPTSFVALLKAVAYGWRQEAIAREAAQISELGNELFERVVIFANHFDGIRKGLDNATEAYNKALSSMESRFLPTARRMAELKATDDKPLPVLKPADANHTRPSAPELASPKVIPKAENID